MSEKGVLTRSMFQETIDKHLPTLVQRYQEEEQRVGEQGENHFKPYLKYVFDEFVYADSFSERSPANFSVCMDEILRRGNQQTSKLFWECLPTNGLLRSQRIAAIRAYTAGDRNFFDAGVLPPAQVPIAKGLQRATTEASARAERILKSINEKGKVLQLALPKSQENRNVDKNWVQLENEFVKGLEEAIDKGDFDQVKKLYHNLYLDYQELHFTYARKGLKLPDGFPADFVQFLNKKAEVPMLPILQHANISEQTAIAIGSYMRAFGWAVDRHSKQVKAELLEASKPAVK